MKRRYATMLRCRFLIMPFQSFHNTWDILFIISLLHFSITVDAFSILSTTSKNTNPVLNSPDAFLSNDDHKHAPTYSFSVPLINKRPKPESFGDKFIELWNDPRPVTSLVGNDRTTVGNRITSEGESEEIPYCILSEEFDIGTELFQILLYPRGRYVSGSGSVGGIASAYLRYLPKEYGEELDVSWNLQLCVSKENTGAADGDDDMEILSISTSGGLPKSNTTWSAAMTFCHELEAVESVGRATDWGSSIWSAGEVCQGLGRICARGNITVFDKRQSGISFSFPPKGALGDVLRSSNQPLSSREFRAGEVIVPRPMEEGSIQAEKLKESFVYPGIDYRIMTMTDGNGNQLFSTSSLSSQEEKNRAKLALRPCGWKLQRQLWQRNGMTQDWPMEVDAELLANVTSTRFNRDSAIPRITAAFQREWEAYALALAVAIMPIPVALFLRTFVSLYAIPSASMEPTLLRGDVLLVEKLPGVYDRTQRGDVVLFRPPPSLTDLIASSSPQSRPISRTSLFVKRLVGVPGDKNIRLDDETREVTIDGKPSMGPNRDLCEDEPLRLIDKMLKNGKGRNVAELGEDEAYVVGDCKAVSVDSRVFGVLPKENIVGKPVARIWPLDRIQLSNKF
ncbi:unnamed protein product [Cylindrotheca closterium]|uniref:Mitochondrial inner membrane protease subunit n=1 Tax=Cylindrotheca closterium TaxID=2856 RepID=A0AAD2JKQ5_9STRA|nr:unnamed protein product [Cylindrotheca closterium]